MEQKTNLSADVMEYSPWLLSGRIPVVPKTERRIEKAMNGGHEMDWVRACKESPESRVKTKSDFQKQVHSTKWLLWVFLLSDFRD